MGNIAVWTVRFDVCLQPHTRQRVPIFLCSSLRGRAKAGESVLVHGASGGVSVPGRHGGEHCSLSLHCSSWDVSCGHVCVKRQQIRFLSQGIQIHVPRTNPGYSQCLWDCGCCCEIPSQRGTHWAAVCCRCLVWKFYLIAESSNFPICTRFSLSSEDKSLVQGIVHFWDVFTHEPAAGCPRKGTEHINLSLNTTGSCTSSFPWVFMTN